MHECCIQVHYQMRAPDICLKHEGGMYDSLRCHFCSSCSVKLQLPPLPTASEEGGTVSEEGEEKIRKRPLLCGETLKGARPERMVASLARTLDDR